MTKAEHTWGEVFDGAVISAIYCFIVVEFISGEVSLNSIAPVLGLGALLVLTEYIRHNRIDYRSVSAMMTALLMAWVF